MLAGMKRAAMFSTIQNPTLVAEIREAFSPHVEAKKIQEKVLDIDDTVIWLIYALPGHEWRLKLIESIARDFANLRQGFLSTFSIEDIDRMLGALLDYEQDDIEEFIHHSQRNKTCGDGKTFVPT